MFAPAPGIPQPGIKKTPELKSRFSTIIIAWSAIAIKPSSLLQKAIQRQANEQTVLMAKKRTDHAFAAEGRPQKEKNRA